MLECQHFYLSYVPTTLKHELHTQGLSRIYTDEPTYVQL